MPDLPPVDEIAAMKDGHAGKVLKGRCDQVIVIACAADGWVRVKAGQDRIAKGSG